MANGEWPTKGALEIGLIFVTTQSKTPGPFMKLFVKGLSIVFCVLWILFILFEYWVQHPEFQDAMRIFSHDHTS